MVDIVSMSLARDRFERGLSGAGTTYSEGVSRRSDSFWQDQTAAASDAWADGVNEAISNGSFVAGVNNPSRSWSERSEDVGARRLTQDTAGAAEAFAEGFGPFRDAIESASLPPRGRRGDPANFERSSELGQMLHELSLER